MADNTQAKAVGEVRNVRIQIRYKAYLADFFLLDISVDKELPSLLGRPFHRTCGAMRDMGRGTMTINDGVIKHTYYPRPRTKAYLENFESDESKDWMICFEVGRDEDEFAVLLGLYSESDVQHRLFETHFLRLMENDEGFNHEAYWSRIGKPRTKKKLADIRHNGNVACILAEYLSKRAPDIKGTSEISGGHFVTKIARRLGFYNQMELAKCSEPIKSESWTLRCLEKRLIGEQRS
ncbi:hypothetical protein Tco_1416463 [Tanacetum coccineum]